MGRSPKEKPNKNTSSPAQVDYAAESLSPVGHEYLSHLVPSINWWSSQK